jgi:hypothetical protein
MAGSSGPGHVEHEKKTFFSLLKNTRSGGVSQGRAFCARRVSGRSAAQSLYGRRSGGYARERAGTPVFSLDPLLSTR